MSTIIAQAVDLLRHGLAPQALVLLDQARLAQPQAADLAYAQGVVALDMGQLPRAFMALRDTLALDPSLAPGWSAYARCLAPQGRVHALKRALALQPLDGGAWTALSHAWREAGVPDQAKAAANQALNAQAGPGGWSALGAARHALLQRHAALCAYATALVLAPDARGDWINLSLVLNETMDHDPAKRAMIRAIHLAPGRGEAEWGLGLLLWLTGDLPAAWPWFEGRLARPGIVRPEIAAKPVWQGEDFSGKTLLWWSEQGQGDTFQFLRFYEAIKARGGRVVVEVQPAVKSLVLAQGRFDHVIARGEPTGPFDLQLAMMSPPAVFALTDATIPPAPYLKAPGRYRLPAAPAGTRLRVGLVWAGNPGNVTEDRVRSFPAGTYQPLLDLDGIAFYSLQVGAGGPPPSGVMDLAPNLTDFAITADALDQLDLLISSCTSVPHLAGALGRPVWLLLNKASHYRWGLKGTATPWYPSFTLYRQNRMDDWADVIATVKGDLSALLTKKI